MDTRHTGPSFDDFLTEEGLLEECASIALARVRAWREAHDGDASEHEHPQPQP